MKNYYEILGLDRDASDQDIKKAYRKLASKYHPDKNLGEDTSDKFKEIKEAYDTLSDKNARYGYDAQHRNKHHGSSFTFNQYTGSPEFDVNDFFKQHGFNTRREPPRTKKRYHFALSLSDAYTGTTVDFKGSQIRIPPGVRTGNIFMHGQDIIEVTVQNHPKFKRANDDLLVDVDINAFDAMLGNEAILTHLDNTRLKFKIPPGTQHGQIIKLSGKGMMNVENSSYGDCLIRCNIVIPRNLTSPQQSAILKLYSKKPVII